jgi:NAD-dependent deacetylase
MTLDKLIKESKYVTAFTGAGISTESGIPDFRSSSGLYTTGKFSGYSPQQILSRRFFSINKEIFFSFYKDRLSNFINKKPNRSHYALVKLEEIGKLKTIITQNIDNLHQVAGSKNVLDLHGNGSKSHCISCQEKYTYDVFSKLLEESSVPRCICGGIVRPSTVLFDEWLNDDTYDLSVEEIKKSDLIISIGSSLSVMPAAGILEYRDKEKCKLVIINNTETFFDKFSVLVINKNCGEVLEEVVKQL